MSLTVTLLMEVQTFVEQVNQPRKLVKAKQWPSGITQPKY